MSSSTNLQDMTLKPSKYFVNPREEMLEFLPAEIDRVLDVGCGEALFGYDIKRKRGAEVWGIELDAQAAREASKKIDHVLVGDVNELLLQLPVKYFDCVIFNDVLEHLVDPYDLLQKVKSNLTDDGVLVCSIPNVRHFRNLYNLVIKKQWRYEDSGILDKTHLRFFTERSIREMFDLLGYEILKMKGIQKTGSLIVKTVNLLSLGFFSDTLFMQYGCAVRPRKRS